MNVSSRFAKYLLAVIWGFWATFGVAENNCVQCERVQGGYVTEISKVDTVIFCNSHKSGRIEFARKHGADLFGSIEAYYKNFHRIQCPPRYPSPLYHSVELSAFEFELSKDLIYIDEVLTRKEKEFLLNRPDKGRLGFTVLDMADHSHRVASDAGNDGAMRRYEAIREKLLSMGAKRSDDLSSSELARYE